MARLCAHGEQLAVRETVNSRIAVMSDGQIMRNWGSGWKLWKRLKAGVDPQEYARKFDERSKAINPWVLEYVKELRNTVCLRYRGELHTLVTLMPEDIDGIWAMFDDKRVTLDFADIGKCCQAYQIAKKQVEEENATKRLEDPTHLDLIF